MGMKILNVAVSMLIFTLILVNVIQATPPPDTIMVPIKQVIDILRESNYQDSGHKELAWQRIRKVIRNNFDFTSFYRQTPGKYWKTFTTQQKREFAAAYFEFLECIYITKLIKGYKSQKMYYDDMAVKQNTVAWLRIKIEN
jgi:phospholipid transport system substrate-binding protein